MHVIKLLLLLKQVNQSMHRMKPKLIAVSNDNLLEVNHASLVVANDFDHVTQAGVFEIVVA